MNNRQTLEFDDGVLDVDVDALIMNPAHEGIAILPWGSTIPRLGEEFAYVEGGTRYVLVAVKYHPRAPTARMRRRYERPDYWLTVRMKGLADLAEVSP